MEKYLNQLLEMVVNYGPKVLGGILILIVGLWLTNIITRWISRIMEQRNLDVSLRPFLRTMISTLMRVLVIIIALGMIGIQMMSFIAILGAATLAVGLALQGTFQNFAGGVMILIFKPYSVGDLIEVQGFLGKVSEIQIFNTIIITRDHKVIIIPNGGLSNSALINYSKEPLREVEWTFGIAYGDDIDKAKSVLMNLIKEDTRILTDPEPSVAVSELADSSVNFIVQVFVINKDYWDVLFAMNENVYKAFGKEGLNIPFPQMDVHLHQSIEKLF
ncbi:MAG: mechanosensitive ion channel domain-containing protein [Bacteroidota bacterium]